MPGVLDLEINQGETWNYEFVVLLDPNSDIVDLTGKTLKMQIRNTYKGFIAMEFTDANGRLVITNGEWEGNWNVAVAYVADDIVKDSTTDYSFYICVLANTGEALTDTTYWIPYRQVRFNLNSTETANIKAGTYLYDLEINDASTTPKTETKLLKGKFIVNPEVTI